VTQASQAINRTYKTMDNPWTTNYDRCGVLQS
jgi:hypothetical protein